MLLHDAQFTEDEYLQRVGWGHSSVAHAVSLARMASVGRLVLFHHDPARDDDQLEWHLARARELWREGEGEGPPVLAREGAELELERLRFDVAV